MDKNGAVHSERCPGLNRITMIKLSKPYLPDEAFDLVKNVLLSGNLVQGENVLLFEQLLAEYLHVPHVVAVSSGTAALHVALTALDIKCDDEVIVPTFSFPAVANAVELVGAKPVFADISLTDFCLDVSKIEQCINSRTRAIMPVHAFGQSADMANIMTLAAKYKLSVIEDAACAIGSEFNKINAGTMGDMGCFSFHPRKILTTGEGGAIVTKDSVLAQKIRRLRNHGMQLMNDKFDFLLPGFNYRMTDFQAALGLAQLPKLNETIRIHRMQAQYYKQMLCDVESIRFAEQFENRFQTYQTFLLLFECEDTRDTLKKQLARNNIESNIGAYAIPGLTYYANKYHLPATEYKNASIAFKHGLALPIGRHLGNDEIFRIAQIVKSVCNNEYTKNKSSRQSWNG